MHLYTAFGHDRLVTNGTQLDGNNNQLVMKDNIVGIHIGIIAQDYSSRSLAEQLNMLERTKIMYYKKQSHKYAEELSSKPNQNKFMDIIRSIMRKKF